MRHHLDRLSSRFVVLWGWRRLAAAFVAGAASALALPPFDLFPILFLTFPALVWLIDGTVASGPKPLRAALWAAAAVGWAFGFGYFLAGLWWIGAAFLVEADVFGWMMPFAVVALPMGLALFTALGTAVARLMWSPGPARIFALAFALALADLARGHALTGFPWNAFGYALTATPVLMQPAAMFGLYGMTLVAVFVFASPAALAGGGGRSRLVPPALAAIMLAGMAGYGALRLQQAGEGGFEETRIRIVQPSIPQAEKWRLENRSEIFARYLELSDQATSPDAMGVADVDLLVWPESALPFVFEAEPEALPAIAALLPERTTLVTGMQRVERNPVRGSGYDVYNSILVIGGDGRVRDAYDKVWLVPFGEFLPLQETLESLGLEQLTRVIGGFAAGARPRTMQAGDAPRFRPLVCYEIIFPRAVIDADDRPGFILNVTNDGWFGDSPGPWQHLRQARLRAVEEGLPVIRAANTGISAVIDPYGRLQATLGLGVRGVLDARLPAALEPTPFRRWGNPLLVAMLLVFMTVALRGKRD